MALFTQTYTFTNGTTADGGQVNTELVALGSSVNSITNDQINSAAAIAISKTALGTYTTGTNYTPTWASSGTQPAIGAGGVVAGRYLQIGKLVCCYVGITFGGAGATAGTGDWTFSLPVTSTGAGAVGSARAFHTGVAFYTGAVLEVSATTVSIYSHAGTTGWGNNVPTPWGTGDTVIFTIVYEAA